MPPSTTPRTFRAARPRLARPRALLVAGLAALAPWVAPPAGALADEATSPGGIEFLHLPVPATDSVAIHVAWPSDWAWTESAAAAPRIGAELVFSGGADGLPAAQVGNRLAELGVNGGMYVVADAAHGYLQAPAASLGGAVELAATLFSAPAFDADEFAKRRAALTASVADDKRELATRVGDLLCGLVVEDDELRRYLTLAPPEMIEETALEDVRRWHRETLLRDGATVAVVGAVDVRSAGEALDTLLGALPEGGDGAGLADEVLPDFAPRIAVLGEAGDANGAVGLFGALPSTSEGAEYEDVIAAELLAGSEGAYLQRALGATARGERELQVVLDSQTARMRGLLMYAEVAPAQTLRVRETLLDTYARFRAEGPTAEEVATVKAALADGVGVLLATPALTARAAVASAREGFGPERVTALADELEAVTAETVKARLGAAWPEASAFVEAVLTSDAEADAIAGTLEASCTLASAADVAKCDRR